MDTSLIGLAGAVGQAISFVSWKLLGSEIAFVGVVISGTVLLFWLGIEAGGE